MFSQPEESVRDGSAGRQRVLQRLDRVTARADRTRRRRGTSARHRLRPAPLVPAGGNEPRGRTAGRAPVPATAPARRRLLRDRLRRRRPRQQQDRDGCPAAGRETV